MRKSIVLSAALFCAAMPAFADADHLVPEVSPFATSEPQAFLPGKAFKDAYSGDVVLRAIVMPWEGNNLYVLGLKSTKTGFAVFDLEPGPAKGTLRNVCETPLDFERARRLVGVWQGMLLQTAYDGPLIDLAPGGGVIQTFAFGEFATAFHFSMVGDFAGQTSTTPRHLDGPPQKLGTLLLIVDDLRLYCRGGAGALTKLDAHLTALQTKLTETDP